MSKFSFDNQGLRTCMTFPQAPISRLRYCFETSACGRIPISKNWQLALNALARLPHTYAQIDHSVGRMSMKLSQGELIDSIACNAGERGLQFAPNFSGWSNGYAKIENCPCCGAAGSVSFCSHYGLQFLRFSPPNDLPANEWAQVLSGFAISPRYTAAEATTETTADCTSLFRPESAEDLLSNNLVGCLDRMARSQMAVTFTMRNQQLTQWNHTEIMSLEVTEDQIFCRGSTMGFILKDSAVKRLSVNWTELGPVLLAVDQDDRILLEVNALPEEGAQSHWALLLNGF
jgi:hypothetical protein